MLIELQRAQQWLNECQLDAIIASSSPNVLYLTDYYLWIQPLFKEYMTDPGAGNNLGHLYGVLTNCGRRALVIDQVCEPNAGCCEAVERFVFGASSTSNVPEPSPNPNLLPFVPTSHRFDTPLRALAAALDTLGLKSARIGLDCDGLPPVRLESLKRAQPKAEFLDASNLFRVLRMVKSSEERRRLQRAAEISQNAALDCLKEAEPGHTMLSIVQKYREQIAVAGADFEHFAYTQRGIGIATEADYRLPNRETMFVDFGCVYQHYYSDAGVTFMAGMPTDRERSAYSALVESLACAAELLRPGIRASAVQATMQRKLDDAGLKGQFPHGHGLGIEVRDYPILAPDNGRRICDDCIDVPSDVAIEAGMIINLEAPVFGFHGAGLQLEQTFLVTANGGRPLTDRDLSEPIIIG